jgi:competence protein ComEC
MKNGFVYGFCACLITSLLWPSLPVPWTWPIFIILAILIGKKSGFSSGFLLAAVWLCYCFNSLFNQNVDLNPKHLAFKAEIVSLVNRDRDWISVDVRVLDDSFRLFPRYYRLSYTSRGSAEPELMGLELGQQWQFIARMKGITSVQNQGGFNQQKNWLSRHIVAKGRIKQGTLLSHQQSVRQRVGAKLEPVFATLVGGDILQALLLGRKQDISTERWQALRRTGSGHLVAISGLHVSVVFALVYFLSRFFLNQFMPCQSRRNLFIAMGLSLCTVLGYGYLSGFAIATQRAVIMLSLLVGLSVCSQYASPWERLVYALFIVLIIDPFAPLSHGFWLSFSALAIILFTLSTQSKQSIQKVESTQSVEDEDLKPTAKGEVAKVNFGLKQCRYWFLSLWAIQWRLALGLGLLQAALFGSLPVHSIWLNLLFVPWFSFVVIPISILCLILWLVLFGISATFFTPDIVNQEIALNFSTWVFTLPELSLKPFLWILQASQALPMAQLSLSEMEIKQALLATMGLILGYYASVYIKQQRWFLLCLSLCLPLFMAMFIRVVLLAFPESPRLEALQSQGWQVHVLDVGQGSAIVIQNGGRGIVYDTGAAYGVSFSYAQRVILPFLSARGIHEIDYLVLSHNDNDHRGGDRVLIEAFPQMRIITDIKDYALKANNPNKVMPCQGDALFWQGLTLDLMGVDSDAINGDRQYNISDNNASCVVRIGDDKHKVLLTGDIEKKREYQLIKHKAAIKATVLLAPHHGSKTSSTSAFLSQVSPELAIFSAGFENQYGFPKALVLTRYHDQGIQALTTGSLGQISLIFTQQGYEISPYRTEVAPFWYNDLFRFGSIKKPE